MAFAQDGICPRWHLPNMAFAQGGICPKQHLPKMSFAQDFLTCPDIKDEPDTCHDTPDQDLGPML